MFVSTIFAVKKNISKTWEFRENTQPWICVATNFWGWCQQKEKIDLHGLKLNDIVYFKEGKLQDFFWSALLKSMYCE